MSDALYNKYRPRSFKDLLGQGSVAKSIMATLERKDSHAFLLHGPSGCGKTTTARICATLLGCARADILEVDAATYSGVDDVRKVTEGLSYQPMGGSQAKVFIIDECHTLSKAAWQALLKSLEEPPPWAYWFLCTTDLGKVPETVRTRCASYQLQLVGDDLLVDLLERIADKEGFEVEGSIIDLCVAEAHGSPRQAIVNLGVCADAKDRRDAADLLHSAQQSVEAIELARMLLQGTDWPRLMSCIRDMKNVEPESARRVVQAYMLKVAMDAKTDRKAERALAVLEHFGQPFASGEGMAPLVLALGRIVLR